MNERHLLAMALYLIYGHDEAGHYSGLPMDLSILLCQEALGAPRLQTEGA